MASFGRWADTGKLEAYLPDLRRDRLARLVALLDKAETYDLSDLLHATDLTVLLHDARSLPYPDDHFTFICSNNTFEHVHTHVLKDILREFQRVLHPAGIMSHFIDLSDHFAHFDRSITIYNFLKFSPRAWQRIDNSIQPQNRLRWREYRELYRQLGIPLLEEATRPGEPNVVAQIAVAPRFRGFTHEELAVSHGYVVSGGGE